MTTSDLPRFTFYERFVHWLVGLTFTYLLVTGLAFSYPKLFWLLSILGGPSTSRMLHPWVGMAFTVGLVLMFFAWVRQMFISGNDKKWLGAMSHYARHERDEVPPTGKYNAGQKLFFWAQIILGVIFLVTGLPMWLPETFGTGIVPAMRFIHFLVAIGGGLLLILHTYLGTALFPGTARGMLYGRVTRAWARLHHPLWYREMGGRD